jgi:hypothetical protein
LILVQRVPDTKRQYKLLAFDLLLKIQNGMELSKNVFLLVRAVLNEIDQLSHFIFELPLQGSELRLDLADLLNDLTPLVFRKLEFTLVLSQQIG